MQYIVTDSDNVILTHVIQCHIGVEEYEDALESPKCKICGELATVYCENDREYFCSRCDEFAHEGDEDDNARNDNNHKHGVLRKLREGHIRKAVDPKNAPH